MPDTDQRRRNSALWWGLIVTLLGVASNFPSFFTSVGATVFPWLTLVLSGLGLALVLLGLKRAFVRPQVFRGKIAGSILTLLSATLLGFSAWLFFHARALPVSAGAPKIGEKAPDFTLV